MTQTKGNMTRMILISFLKILSVVMFVVTGMIQFQSIEQNFHVKSYLRFTDILCVTNFDVAFYVSKHAYPQST